MTQYGWRNECCDLHSWGGKPLVSQAVHDARRVFHRVFDPLWKYGHMTRGEAYRELSRMARLPEDACHGATQTDVLKLAHLIEMSRRLRAACVKRRSL